MKRESEEKEEHGEKVIRWEKKINKRKLFRVMFLFLILTHVDVRMNALKAKALEKFAFEVLFLLLHPTIENFIFVQ